VLGVVSPHSLVLAFSGLVVCGWTVGVGLCVFRSLACALLVVEAHVEKLRGGRSNLSFPNADEHHHAEYWNILGMTAKVCGFLMSPGTTPRRFLRDLVHRKWKGFFFGGTTHTRSTFASFMKTPIFEGCLGTVQTKNSH